MLVESVDVATVARITIIVAAVVAVTTGAVAKIVAAAVAVVVVMLPSGKRIGCTFSISRKS